MQIPAGALRTRTKEVETETVSESSLKADKIRKIKQTQIESAAFDKRPEDEDYFTEEVLESSRRYKGKRQPARAKKNTNWIPAIFLAALPVINVIYLVIEGIIRKSEKSSWARSSLIFVFISYVALIVLGLKLVEILKFYFFI